MPDGARHNLLKGRHGTLQSTDRWLDGGRRSDHAGHQSSDRGSLCRLPASLGGPAQPGGRRSENRLPSLGRNAERRKAIAQIADVIEQNSGELARLLTQEQGKSISDATVEVMGMAGFFRYFATLDLPVRIIEDSAGRKVEAYRRPLGVVGAIIPWN
jgi:hypothetical protein